MRVPSIPYLSREEGERKKRRNKGRYWPGESLETADFAFFVWKLFFSEVKWKYSPFNGQKFHVKFFRFHEVPLDV